MSNNSDTNQFDYEAIGVISPSDNPDIINGFILKDNATGYHFRASMLETKELVAKGKLVLPEM